jgi:hypothetical protein
MSNLHILSTHTLSAPLPPPPPPTHTQEEVLLSICMGLAICNLLASLRTDNAQDYVYLSYFLICEWMHSDMEQWLCGRLRLSAVVEQASLPSAALQPCAAAAAAAVCSSSSSSSRVQQQQQQQQAWEAACMCLHVCGGLCVQWWRSLVYIICNLPDLGVYKGPDTPPFPPCPPLSPVLLSFTLILTPVLPSDMV